MLLQLEKARMQARGCRLRRAARASCSMQTRCCVVWAPTVRAGAHAPDAGDAEPAPGDSSEEEREVDALAAAAPDAPAPPVASEAAPDAAAASDDAPPDAAPAEPPPAPAMPGPEPAPALTMLPLAAGAFRVGRLQVGPAVLGYGSGGTVVFEGLLEGRPVAVKRLLAHFHELAKKARPHCRHVALVLRCQPLTRSAHLRRSLQR
jgi:hypothetical protein